MPTSDSASALADRAGGAPDAGAGAASWFVLYTKSRHEKTVDEGLRRIGLESYLPLRQELRRWKDRRKLVELPLFPGYVFLGCAEKDRQRAFAVAGIVRFVSGDGGVIAVPDHEIDAIREALRRHVPYDPHPELQPGQPVEVIGGPMRGVRGLLIRRGRKHRLQLSIHALGRGISVEIDAADARPI